MTEKARDTIRQAVYSTLVDESAEKIAQRERELEELQHQLPSIGAGTALQQLLIGQKKHEIDLARIERQNNEMFQSIYGSKAEVGLRTQLVACEEWIKGRKRFEKSVVGGFIIAATAFIVEWIRAHLKP